MKGTYWNKKTKKFLARVIVDGQTIYLGSNDTEEAAARLFDVASLVLRRTDCNYPDEGVSFGRQQSMLALLHSKGAIVGELYDLQLEQAKVHILILETLVGL